VRPELELREHNMGGVVAAQEVDCRALLPKSRNAAWDQRPN
jgi:hypothetical protein